ncbi:MAG: hypothetical protein IPK77_16855 [Cellvibrio sp.]|nr:hypothetical protein [Cellvibrio sp.]
MSAFVFLLVFFRHSAEAAQQSAYFSFRHITRSGCGIGYINSIAQDKTGFMLFGGANEAGEVRCFTILKFIGMMK